ncbi:DUF4412 domain-containing protein [Psychroserpens burtonensis]|uniref:DUF4412 domain-containing protein n=1 Tax=Psychroserpens burtonensis TaxID=49278 RepID=A0A5C7B7Y1_9FLAO|nr:DUF4412 domain-containing protein [Psychroserpens burtonensis]TXE16949.1 DUF4412 domain-containing protein [Psychroserpens burtonensis]
MKTLKPLLLTFAFLFISNTSQAQIWKKLKKKAEQAVEDVIVKKTADKAAQMAGKGMDKIFNIDFDGAQADPSILPESYDFEWKYTMQMTHKKGNMNMTYYLKPGAKYFGSQPELEDNPMANGMFMVFDEKLDIMAIFMETEDGKSGTLLKNPSIDIEDIAEQEEVNLEDYTFTKIGTKAILGFECQGYQMENDEMKITMYMAMDAPVSFNQIYGSHMKTKPKGFDPKWMEMAENSIVLEMDMIHKKKKKYNVKMTCVALEKSPKTLVVSDYEFMDLNTDQGR